MTTSNLDTLAAAIVRQQNGACLAIDDQGVLVSKEGELAAFGVDHLKVGKPALDDMSYLHGVLPLEGTDFLQLPNVQVDERRVLPLTIVRMNNLNWVVFSDPNAVPKNGTIHSIDFKEDKRQDALLDKYLGKEMRKRVAAGLDSIEKQGERREVAVLFADLRGFTGFCDLNSTVDIFPLLNQFLGSMIKPVAENNGLIDKIMGDAVMAVFGLNDGGNYKAAAIRAGIEMIHEVSKITEAVNDTNTYNDPLMGLGVGIASGQVALGILGGDRRRSFSVIGHRVNLAARLEGQARPGELLVDVATWESISDPNLNFSLTDLWLKGLTRPVPAMSYFPLKSQSPNPDSQTLPSRLG
ncbi:MAG: adenylate/guanylate cyclase domain-containing protein [Gammaproteobacteria bacterium]